MKTIKEALTEIPLVEPVTISKALLAGRQAEVWRDGGVGPKAMVALVNIGLTGWVHTAETAKAFSDGYNLALKQLKNALLSASAEVEISNDEQRQG